jgi:hypothetical protein
MTYNPESLHDEHSTKIVPKQKKVCILIDKTDVVKNALIEKYNKSTINDYEQITDEKLDKIVVTRTDFKNNPNS